MVVKRVGLFCMVLIGLSSATVWAQSWTLATEQLVWLGSPTKVTVWAQTQDQCETVMQMATEELQRLEQAYSAIRQGSVVNELNQFGGERPIRVDAETEKLLRWSRELSEKTEGAFDITTTNYKWQYGFGQSDYRKPNDLRIRQIMPLVNYKFIAMYPKDKTVLFRKSGVQIDFDILLIDHAFNRLQPLFKKKKIKSIRLQIENNVLVLGELPSTLAVLEVTDPAKKAEVITRLQLRPGKVLQADVYHPGFKIKDKWIHPFLDVKTGRPAENTRLVMVYLPMNSKLDIPAGVLMLLPPDKSLDLINSVPLVECLLLDHQSVIFRSLGWEKLEQKRP
jgi:FAD:protein FMN transferase